MWQKIEPERLIIDRVYELMDGQRFVYKGKFTGESFQNPVTKEIIKNIQRIWI